MQNESTRHQRWLHPRRLPAFWVGLLCVLTAPVVALGLLGWFALMRTSRWWQSQRRTTA
ncbi:hypothetical protein [Ferrimonas balearica]|uniref:hypothetical protein n=1 Tax=Ferrimonas balearica TaxID=44012 RepID=UPI001F2CEB3E|nr:hypothetical protein [Ferrimonas balearica]MBY6093727.1 hypothetical protein [Ferrimonas balearica]